MDQAYARSRNLVKNPQVRSDELAAHVDRQAEVPFPGSRRAGRAAEGFLSPFPQAYDGDHDGGQGRLPIRIKTWLRHKRVSSSERHFELDKEIPRASGLERIGLPDQIDVAVGVFAGKIHGGSGGE